MITAADYDQDGKDELCLMFGSNTLTFNAPYVILDDRDAGFAKLHGGTVGNTGAQLRAGNVIAADFTGDGLPDTVFAGNIANGYSPYLILLKTTIGLDFKPVFTMVESANQQLLISNNTFPPLAAGDVDGDRKMDLFAGGELWTFKGNNQFERVDNTDIILAPSADNQFDLRGVMMGDVTGDQKDDVVFFAVRSYVRLKRIGMIGIYYYSGGQYRLHYQDITDNSETFTDNSADYSGYEIGCLPNVDNDSFILRDTGQRELLLTDPHVIAVLASPPYYDGINEDGDGGTSFGYSKSAAEGSSESLGFSVGVSVGYEFEAPFNLSSAEFEVSVTSSFAWAQSNAVEISESWGWNNPIAQDLAVFTAIPFDVYYYEVLKSPPGEEAKPGDILTVSVPRKPQPYHMPLPNYNAGVPEEHRITVNHTLGDPGSYFTTAQRDQQKRAAGDRGLFSTTTQMTAGAGSGSTTINIEKVTTEEDTYTFDLETQISAKIGIGGAKVGVSAGFNYGYETTSSVSEGTYIEGTVPAIPMASYNSTRDFNWGLMAYPKKDSYQDYIFVTYWTKFNN